MKKLSNWERETFGLIKKLIGKKGYKLTNQRKKVLSIFIKNDQRHFTAEEIYGELEMESIGIATIYRSVKLFVDLNIINEFKVDDTNHYELKMYAKKPLHIHFKCENCGRIEDIIDQEIILEYFKINKLIEEKQQNEIFDIDIMFRGLCRDCIAKDRDSGEKTS